ncbi:unnamed protein product [Microthlaspi erraticum]|uniref:Cysteine-rich receptor-like protein kinase 10 n=1 Tax=Microthlaspi erraticum TaxID=1685480 RepID=A0A6D2JZL2_9BRAS|nr:unnamed protein product [Microthlaspi erraticum]CAA7060176.1 unnamed protein product [Microthlaspi erraticum]
MGASCMIRNLNQESLIMSSSAFLIFLFLFSFLTSFTASAKDPYFLYNFCPNTKTFSRKSTYFTNLITVFSTLSSPNASFSTGFQNATAGEAPNKVTGLFLCRGDLSPEVCRKCVEFSIIQAIAKCRNAKEVVLYYDECMLRYSHTNILSTVILKGGYFMLNKNKISLKQEDRFGDFVSSTMNQAAIEAASSSIKFSAMKTNWTALQTLYVLVQCTPDLRKQDCLSCLHKSIDGMSLNNLGGRVLWPSCSSRYEMYPFYNETAFRTPPRPEKGGNLTVLVVAIVLVAIIVVVLLFTALYCFLAKRAKKTSGDDIITLKSLQRDYRTIQAATNDFAESNKIGQVGFGEVYKGTFPDGTEVAVKRLSKSSGKGEAEFKKEVVVAAKLQHKNLVRLLGFSLQGEERILVYEYVPNKSLDYFLSDPAKQDQLDWTRRYKIIGGIARGILYLHQESRLTIIHRDLKASNILMDADMNPKIADFGMSRIFGMDQTKENTNKIVDTYGYMSPEYAMHGQFSMKSDVYSFGVLLLEIISGRKSSSFNVTDGAHDLVTYAWRLWSNGTALGLVDPVIVENCQKSEVVRCIHIGLLCVQEDPVERPTMRTIFMMLTSNTVTLPLPRQPVFFHQSEPQKDPLDSDQSTTTKSVPTSVDNSAIDH